MNNLSELLFTLCGVTIFAYFVNIGCDPFTEGAIENQNEVSLHRLLFFSYYIYKIAMINKFELI